MIFEKEIHAQMKHNIHSIFRRLYTSISNNDFHPHEMHDYFRGIGEKKTREAIESQFVSHGRPDWAYNSQLFEHHFQLYLEENIFE